MNASAHTMTRVDTAWRRMDTDVNLMMIVGVWLLRPAIRYEDVCERVRARLLRYERFRQKVEVGAFGSRWVDDEDFDLARHVVIERLHPRKGQSARDALQQRMGALASTPLDPAHPLWQFHLFEDYDGGSASVCRIHHCVGDGIALNSVMLSIADGGEMPPELDTTAAAARIDDTHRGDWVSDALLRPITAATVKSLEVVGSALVKSIRWLEHPDQALADAGQLADEGAQVLRDVATLALLPNDSPTRLKGHGSGRKVVAWCEPLPLEPVKLVGKALGASINDVLLSCAAGAIGRYLRDEGDDTEGCDIRALVPVNLRPLSEAWQLGNRFGLLPLLVPVGIANPIQRLAVVHERMSALKGSFLPMLSYGLLGVSGALTEPGQKALASLFLDKTTAVMTNVPGPREPVKFCGSTVAQSIFWVPSSGDVGVGLSIISYAGGVQFGLITDDRLCPRPSRIIDRFATEFEQLQLLSLMLPWQGQDGGQPLAAEEVAVLAARLANDAPCRGGAVTPVTRPRSPGSR